MNQTIAPKVGMFDLLDRIRKRPSMYCVVDREPLETIETMLSGYEQAVAMHRVEDPGDSFNAALRYYILVRFGWSTCAGWNVAIRDHLRSGQSELDRFFEIVDELLTVRNELGLELSELARRLDGMSLGLDGYRRRRRAWVVERLRETRVAADRAGA